MKKATVFLIAAWLPSVLCAQIIDMKAALAEDAFQDGVNAFHYGFLNKAYLYFEQALTQKPQNPLYSFWLAETYFRNGYTNDALTLWEQLIQRGYEPTVLKSRVEQVRRMSLPPAPLSEVRYTVSHEINGSPAPASAENGKKAKKADSVPGFMGPVAITPNAEGGIYTTSYLTGEIAEISANGQISRFYRKKLNRYQKPFDLISVSPNEYFLSESGRNCLHQLKGPRFHPQRSFGETGSGDAQFNGPQFITTDGEAFLYVCDVGNARVCKYTLNGDFLFSFGEKTPRFPGLKIPTGIVWHGGRVVVADQREDCLYFFDAAGNFLGEAVRGLLSSPQGLTSVSDSEILIADGQRLLLFNAVTETLSLLSDFNGLAKQPVKADFDLNGNIAVSDFRQNKILYLTDRSLLYSGLYLQVETVDSSHYPAVNVVFTVKDSSGRPFCGLNAGNFLLKEAGAPVRPLELLYSDVRSQKISVALLMDYSEGVFASPQLIDDALQTYFSALKTGDTFTLVSEDRQPLMQARVTFREADDLHQADAFREILHDPAVHHDENGRFDLALHECVNRLLNSNGKRCVIYMTDGNLDAADFTDYNLTKTENYLVNNNVAFYYIQMVPQAGSGEETLRYLAQRTGGKGFSAFSPTGLSQVMPTLRSRHDGRYEIRYHSTANDDYGRRYLDLDLEVNHFNRTGRMHWGYYAPLDFKYKKN